MKHSHLFLCILLIITFIFLCVLLCKSNLIEGHGGGFGRGGFGRGGFGRWGGIGRGGRGYGYGYLGQGYYGNNPLYVYDSYPYLYYNPYNSYY